MRITNDNKNIIKCFLSGHPQTRAQLRKEKILSKNTIYTLNCLTLCHPPEVEEQHWTGHRRDRGERQEPAMDGANVLDTKIQLHHDYFKYL